MRGMMRYAVALLALQLLAACSDDNLTRNFGVTRDAAPETMASTQMPLSVPPDYTRRPERPDVLAMGGGDAQSTANTGSVSAGQDALIQAAGPSAPANVRREIDQNSGLTYPPRAFVERLMTWSPPPGYSSVIVQGSSGGWFSGLF